MVVIEVCVAFMVLPPPSSNPELQEHGGVLAPRFDASGLVTSVTVDHATKAILMVAHMNEEAIRETLASGFATYWSRSRASLWRKGETSGERQKVKGLYVDCDQDAVMVEVEVEGRGSACHNGYKSCFYRRVRKDGASFHLDVIDEPVVSASTLYPSSG